MTPYSKDGGWNIVALGRWVGIVVVISALVCGAYDFLWIVATANSNDPDDRILLQGLANVWRWTLSLGSTGVLIILLAELLDRATWDDSGEAVIRENQDEKA